jgi:hypothetical protein
MGFWDFVDDFDKSIAEGNILPIGIGANLANLGDDPVGAITGIGGLLAPPLGFLASFPGTTSKEANLANAGNTPVIAAGLAALKDMRDQCGDGDPDDGSDFTRGASAFQHVGDALSETGTPESWRGTASDVYGTANETQRLAAGAMAGNDAKVQEALATEAKQVADTRDTLDFYINFLNGCIPIALAMAPTPVVGDYASYGFQVQSVAAAMAPATLRFEQLTSAASHNALTVRGSADLYRTVGDRVDGGAAIPGPGPEVDFDTGVLRQLSSHQRDIATQIGSAGQTTTDAPDNVSTSHGSVCAGTSAAVSEAVQARTAAAAAMQRKSDVLAEGLLGAADAYDRTVDAQRAKLEGQMHPR